ncbi:MAG: outer membrane lipoprotein chaperone LolA [Deltaproteobacteria bacterium]|nr:outer membrane lipoprotein chaperone LolA [Deltaproteobacteria bacterium]
MTLRFPDYIRTAPRRAGRCGLALGGALCSLALLTALGSPVLRAAPSQGCGSGLLQRVQKDYATLKGFRAAFTQQDRSPDGRTREAQGEVEYRRPGQMRWAYLPPNEQLLVTDGTTVWLYDPLLDNVTVQPLKGLTQGTPLSFLLGAGNLEADFVCRPFTKPPPEDGLAHLELVPREPIPGMAYIQLAAEPVGGRIAALLMVDAQGNERRVRFDKLQPDGAIAAERFVFKITPGMEVIRKEAP